MSDAQEPNPFGVPLGDVWNDVPLFRELQRVLLSSSGPVNWELARQVGIAGARGAGEDPKPAPRTTGTRSRRPSGSPRCRSRRSRASSRRTTCRSVQAVRRAEWIADNHEGLRSLLEPAGGQARRGDRHGARDPRCPKALPMSRPRSLGQLSPLLLGAAGRLGARVPRAARARAVRHRGAASRAARARSCSSRPTSRRSSGTGRSTGPTSGTWVAIHEVTHRFEFSRPWATPAVPRAAR